MNPLSPSDKLNVLKGMSMKMNSPQASMSMFKSPKLPGTPALGQISARTKKEVDPDYIPQHKSILTGKLY